LGALVPTALFAERRDHEAALKNSAYNRQRQAPLHRAYNSRQDVPLVNHYGVTLVFPNFFPNIQSPTPGSRCGARRRCSACSPYRRTISSDLCRVVAACRCPTRQFLLTR